MTLSRPNRDPEKNQPWDPGHKRKPGPGSLIIWDPSVLPEARAIALRWKESLLGPTISRTRKGMEEIWQTSKIEDMTLNTLEHGGILDQDGNIVPLRDEKGKRVLCMRNFRPIKHSRSGQSQLFVYKAEMERSPGDFVRERTARASGRRMRVPTDEIVIKFWAGEEKGQGNLTKDLQFYEAAAKVRLSGSDTSGKQETLLDWTPFVCHIPANQMPKGCGGVLVTREGGNSLYDILTEDNAEERSAVRRLLWYKLAVGHEFHEKGGWKERIATALGGGEIADQTVGQLIFDPKGKLYDPNSTEERREMEKQCEEAIGLVLSEEHTKRGIMKKFGELLSGFSDFIRRQPVEQWCRDDLGLMISVLEPRNRGHLPPLMQRLAEEFRKCSEDFVGTRFPVTVATVEDLALQIAMELQMREKKTEALDIFEHDYLQLVAQQKKKDPKAHIKSVDRLREQCLTSLRTIARLFFEIAKPEADLQFYQETALTRRKYLRDIRSAIQTMESIKRHLPSMCSEWASFCAPDFHWGNILISPKTTKKTDGRSHHTLIIDQAREWPGNDPDPLSGSSIGPISFLQVRRKDRIVPYDRDYCEKRLRKIADQCGIIIGLEKPEQRNCQRQIAKAEACFYDAMRQLLSATKNPESTDFPGITSIMDQGLAEVKKLREYLAAQEKARYITRHTKKRERKRRNKKRHDEYNEPLAQHAQGHEPWQANQKKM